VARPDIPEQSLQMYSGANRKQNEAAMRKRFLQARKRGELSKDINVDDYTRYLSSILAGLSIQAANRSTKAELERTAQMALRHLGY
jgi:hypothetical protein